VRQAEVKSNGNTGQARDRYSVVATVLQEVLVLNLPWHQGSGLSSESSVVSILSHASLISIKIASPLYPLVVSQAAHESLSRSQM